MYMWYYFYIGIDIRYRFLVGMHPLDRLWDSMILTIYIKLHKLHKFLHGVTVSKAYLFSLLSFLITACAHFWMLIFAQALQRFYSYLHVLRWHFWDTLSDKLPGTCMFVRRSSYVCLKIDRSNLMGRGRFSLVIGCMRSRRDDI
jgi:hypothetical protein